MNKLIRDQLEKVQVADLSRYDKEQGIIDIPKFSQVRYEVDHCYLICLNDTLLNESGNPILVVNWNHNTFPKCKYMKVDVSKEMGKMIFVNGLGYDYENNVDLNYAWSGWLPIQQIQLINKL